MERVGSTIWLYCFFASVPTRIKYIVQPLAFCCRYVQQAIQILSVQIKISYLCCDSGISFNIVFLSNLFFSGIIQKKNYSIFLPENNGISGTEKKKMHG